MFWDIIDKISIILGLISFTSCLTIIYTWCRKNRIDKKIKKGVIKAGASAVLFVTIGQDSVESSVKKHINRNADLKAELNINSFDDLTENNFFCILKEEPIYVHDCAAVDQYETEIDNQLQSVSKSIKKFSIKRVHLFYCGPATYIAKIAAELSNRCTIIAYHYAPGDNECYYSIGPLV